MRICFAGPANSTHIIKWCNWFNGRGYDIHVISFIPGEIEGATVHLIDLGVDVGGSDVGKLKYLTTGRQIKKLIDDIQPDIVSVHYATSYGIAVALSGVKNYVLSVWGSDIYDFPRKSPLHKALLKHSLWKAPHLFSTSKAMAREAAKYTKKQFEITPFGVDMALFNPNKRTRSIYDKTFIIGTVKALADIYGIDYILKAVAIIKEENLGININIRIAGDGPDADKYKKLAKKLGIEDITKFLGKISQEQAAKEWANMDVAVIPSVLYESYGVAAVEAQASAIPVVISNVGGLKETTKPGKTSIIVEKKNEREIAEAISELYNNPELRRQMGIEGRKNVQNKYEINRCFEHIESIFREIIGI